MLYAEKREASERAVFGRGGLYRANATAAGLQPAWTTATLKVGAPLNQLGSKTLRAIPARGHSTGGAGRTVLFDVTTRRFDCFCNITHHSRATRHDHRVQSMSSDSRRYQKSERTARCTDMALSLCRQRADPPAERDDHDLWVRGTADSSCRE